MEQTGLDDQQEGKQGLGIKGVQNNDSSLEKNEGSLPNEMQIFEAMEAKGVMIERRGADINPDDVKLIEEQMGHVPTNMVSVASRDHTGKPTVLKLYPLAVTPKAVRRHRNTDRQPFPTMYWLSCPLLKASVSQLESEGLVSRWEKRLQENPSFIEEMRQSHRSYAEERLALVTVADLSIINQRGWENSIGANVGVGGIKDPATIKCLHTHYGHFLATGQNLVGKWVQDALKAGVHIARTWK